MVKITFRWLIYGLIAPLLPGSFVSCGDNPAARKGLAFIEKIDSIIENETPDQYHPANALLVLPANPAPGESFRILAIGGSNIRNAGIVVGGPSGKVKPTNTRTGEELPCWRIDHFEGATEGNYKVSLTINGKETCKLEFPVGTKRVNARKGIVWETVQSWDSRMETIYAAWVNALFQGCGEQSSWTSLSEVTQNKDRNFLFNHLSLGEDDPKSRDHVIMEPDCADNPFFLRAYFAWKLGLPFGYHSCDRGYPGHSPQTGQWITNQSPISKTNAVQAFNSFIRTIMNGVHSGTARTALNNEHSDYYPVALDHQALRPGTVFADPYGHTLILVSWIPQTKFHPGLLLAVDAQPDKTIAIKRFWRGNFLFNTSEVVGEPGFKAFRPIIAEGSKLRLMKNEALTSSAGFAAFSLQQRKMDSEAFYLDMERLINPRPLDPEEALTDLIQALHQQLQVRVQSVENGEKYIHSHPGTIIPMPSGANGIFLAGGVWEDFSTPNRDLRLLIAMDAVINFPERVARSPQDFKISKSASPEKIKKDLQSLLDKKVSELTIRYTRSDGSLQKLTVDEILKRRDAFEMAYNPNDGVEIRWGAPEHSNERATCRRHAPASQQKTMQAVRKWFNKRLHPPT